MGQARQRREEIAALKAKQTTVTFLAIRHCQDGSKEFTLSEVSVNERNVNDKGALLREICLRDWLHEPPVGLIAEYLVQTTSYQIMGQFGGVDRGYVINFHEVDEELSTATERHYSCRRVCAMAKDRLIAYAEELRLELQATGEYTIQEHCER